MSKQFVAKYLYFSIQSGIIAGLVYLTFGKKIGVAIFVFISSYIAISLYHFLNNKLNMKTALNKGRTIEAIDKISGSDFELYLEAMFTKIGYQVTRTPTSGDYGADLIMEDKHNRIVVQAKRYSGNVGVKAVQEVQGARSYYKANEAWVITNSYFTPQARSLAKSCDVTLIDRDKLLTYVRQSKK